ncbi:MAG TPA: extracellular solute-binding protein [Arenibaculum sp.]|nr:extracellular solute-binding protein [Arenibaculum sp.]
MTRREPGAAGRYSLRRRLLVRLSGALAVLGAILFAFVHSHARSAADDVYDRLLLASALSIADTVRVRDGRITVDLPYSSFKILTMARRDRIFYRITDPKGMIVTGYGDLPVPEPAAGEEPLFADAVYLGTPVRVAVLGRLVTGPGNSGRVTIAVAQTREERGALARDFLVNAFLPILLAILAAAALMWLGIRQSLSPLGALERAIRSRQPQQLDPIAMPPPAEVSQLVHAINQLMGRYRGNLEKQQAFIADAAHQIRTPLASLRSQAELAIDEDDPERLRSIAGRIHRNAVEAGRLASQLLNHAMVMYRSESVEPEDADLGSALVQVVHRAEVISEGAPIRLAIDPEAEPAIVSGDAITLREALDNIVGNAVRYGGRAGPLEIRLAPAPESEWLRVEVFDRGPGIPDGEKEAVFERFGRGSSAAGTTGSGLGLAIAKAVADAHGGRLDLHDRPGGGLVVRFDLPRKPGTGGRQSPRRRRDRPALAPIILLAVLAATPRWATGAEAARVLTLPAPGTERERLLIHGTTDIEAVAPLLHDFRTADPDVAIDYVETTTQALYRDTVARNGGPDREERPPDLLVSSAVDLQVKLVNDGYTRPHLSEAAHALPDWAHWRDEAFGFTFEPAVIVYNTELVPESEVPRTRDDLIGLLRERRGRYSGRVATYDIAESGIGYLLATRDSVVYSRFWQLAALLGQARARLACCTGDILGMVESGEALIGYNVLGSYARARAAEGAPIGIVLPEDYTLVVSRVAVIPATAPNPHLAGRFIDYLLSPRAQRILADAPSSSGILPATPGGTPAASPDTQAGALLQPIAIDPALLVFRDPLKRRQFLEQWRFAFQSP